MSGTSTWRRFHWYVYHMVSTGAGICPLTASWYLTCCSIIGYFCLMEGIDDFAACSFCKLVLLVLGLPNIPALNHVQHWPPLEGFTPELLLTFPLPGRSDEFFYEVPGGYGDCQFTQLMTTSFFHKMRFIMDIIINKKNMVSEVSPTNFCCRNFWVRKVRLFLYHFSKTDPQSCFAGHPWEQSTGADPWWILCISIGGTPKRKDHHVS